MGDLVQTHPQSEIGGQHPQLALDGDHVTARLTPNEDAIVFIELRGNSRVAGGSGTLDSMSARDIDLDYTDDGKTLERVLLTGSAAVAMSGQNGASGRQMMGETLDVVLASDGSVTRATGREKVQLDFPASEGAADAGPGECRTRTGR